MSKKKVVDVVQDEEAPVHVSVLAKSIVEMGQTMRRLLSSGLNRRAIVVLIHDSLPGAKPPKSGKLCSKREVEAVIDAMESLEEKYIA